MEDTLLPGCWKTLQPEEPQQLYALIDAAAHSHIQAHIDAWQPPAVVLKAEGFKLPDEAAPWLVHLKQDNTFSNWYLQQGLFSGWGIILHSRHKLRALAGQLSPWLSAQSDSGQPLLIRFYDPHIIHAYLSLLSSEERGRLLNGISALWRPTGEENQLEQLTFNETEILRRRVDLSVPQNPGEADTDNGDDADADL